MFKQNILNEISKELDTSTRSVKVEYSFDKLAKIIADNIWLQIRINEVKPSLRLIDLNMDKDDLIRVVSVAKRHFGIKGKVLDKIKKPFNHIKVEDVANAIELAAGEIVKEAVAGVVGDKDLIGKSVAIKSVPTEIKSASLAPEQIASSTVNQAIEKKLANLTRQQQILQKRQQEQADRFQRQQLRLSQQQAQVVKQQQGAGK